MKRNTIQRTLVLEAVNHLRSHATAEEVYDAIVQQHPHISKGTVYRNLNQLAKDGEIQKLEMPDGPDCFDHHLQRHYHAKCSRCGRVLISKWTTWRIWLIGMKDAYGFAIDGHNLVFTGVCPTCQQRHAVGSLQITIGRIRAHLPVNRNEIGG